MLSKVHRYIKYVWPQVVPEELIPYSRKQEELTAEGHCLLWGIRVIIPSKLRHRVLQELHNGHPGVVRMKQTARI